MKNANRNMILAAAAALTLAVAPSAPADVRVHVNLPLPPAPHEVLRHLPVPPLPAVVDVRHDGRWNYENRYRDDRYGYRHNGYRYDSRYRDAARWAYVEGRWIARPYRGAVWVTGYYDRWGRWLPGYWTRVRYR
jgi:hypothetical protein